MRIMVILSLTASTLLSGCVGVVAYGQTRESARPLIEKVMAQARPELDSAAAAKCVLKSVSIPETVALGVSDTTVVTSAARTKVQGYAARPKSVACLNALPNTGSA